MSLDSLRSTTAATETVRSSYDTYTSPSTGQADVAARTTGPYVPEPSYNPSLMALLPQARPNDGNAANAASFDADVRGQDAKPIDLQLMQISAAVYDPSIATVGGWTRLSDAQLTAAGIDPATLENPETGFRAGIYTDGDGKYVLAFAGSNELQDWTGANFEQGVGWQNEQYDQAVQLAQLADAAFGENLVITGHSLGGGLAGTASLATGNAAVTFNASGVHDATIERLGLDPDSARADAAGGQIRRYNISGDPLTGAQEDVFGSKWVMPDAPGHEINLADPYQAVQAPEWTWNPVEMARRTYEYGQAKLERTGALHGQQGVLDALEQQQPWNR